MDKLLIIAGTNASGKSDLGVRLALGFGAEIVSADSRQVFKGLDLGSGKISPDEMRGVPHHLLDVAEPGEFFSLKHYQEMAYSAVDDIIARGKKAFLVGGTGLYINSVADGYCLSDAEPDIRIRKQVEAMSLEQLKAFVEEKRPGELSNLDLNNKRRLERAAEKIIAGAPRNLPSSKRYETCIIGVTWPRPVLYERIRVRLVRRLDEGMLDEVRGLLEKGVSEDFLYRLGLEYRYCLMYLKGEFGSYEAFFDKLFMEIRHLAKEQMTWFRKRKDIHWIDMEDEPYEAAVRLIESFYRDCMD